MKTIRFPISDETNKRLMEIKGSKLKQAYAAEIFEKTVNAEYRKQQKK